jgi:hypothetical protein
MKKVDLEDECKKLGIDLTQNLDQHVGEDVKPPVKTPVKTKKVVIQEPDDSSDESSDEDEDVPTKLPQTTAPSPEPTVVKKLSRKNQRVEKLEKVKVEPDNSKKKAVNDILKDLNLVVKELFSEFDKNSIDDVDEEYIRNEFNMTLNDAQDMIDRLVENFTDSEIAKIEAKIDLMYTKLGRFLS